MRIAKKSYKTLTSIIVGLLIVISVESCNTTDDMPPVITLVGSESLDLPLNEVYVDAGATAIDETDGDISSSVYTDNTIDINYLAEYIVTYTCVDKAGNEAIPVTRTVDVINSSYAKMGNYNAYEARVFFPEDTCSYVTYLDADYTVNNRLVFKNFACEEGLAVYADIENTIIEIPLQTIEDSIRKISFQGAGNINDTLIFIKYTRYTDTLTTYWNATFNLQ